jgi:non-ribosomal peptide synthetase component F
LLGRVREVVFGALSHEDVPFQRLVKELQSERDLSRNPLFQIMISLEPSLPRLAPGWDLTQADVCSGASKLDLYIDLDERPDGIIGPITYNPDLFDAATIARMVAHWQVLLGGALADPDTRVAALPLLTGEERNELLVRRR